MGPAIGAAFKNWQCEFQRLIWCLQCILFQARCFPFSVAAISLVSAVKKFLPMLTLDSCEPLVRGGRHGVESAKQSDWLMKLKRWCRSTQRVLTPLGPTCWLLATAFVTKYRMARVGFVFQFFNITPQLGVCVFPIVKRKPLKDCAK